ncbi:MULTISPECIES: hypothetical protein [Vibrio]|uniref:hypothetical protein n=1 Tax=Vibrio TaxID=662 RepID=UPI001EE9FC0B|nr:hypothetical protein [Vibrio furnissii]
MNTTGEKQKGDKALFDNLARINAILDSEQQRSFNTWVYYWIKKMKLMKVILLRCAIIHRAQATHG